MARLAARLAQGEETAFAELYAEFADRLHHYLTVLTGRRADADEALQEVYLRLVQYRSKLAEVEDLAGYLFRMARNEGLRRRRPIATPLVASDLFAPAKADPLVGQEIADAVAHALGDLPVELREVVTLKIHGGLTLREIATIVGAPQGTVATRYRAALGRLRPLLESFAT